ncbi:MAG: hypothetical protein ACPGLV_10260, partial [Bacteroidia bacterium]
MIDIIKANCEKDFRVSSRIHQLHNYFKSESVYIKRDDELGFGIGGSKVRKFASILKAINTQNPEYVVIEGSLNSNNVLGVLALLNSLNYKVAVAAPKSNTTNIGNALWIKTINPIIIQTESTSGFKIDFYSKQLNTQNLFVIKEGAAQIESIPGLLTQGHEIFEFENNQQFKFKQIFIDSGTGITAIALLIAYALRNQKAKFNVTLIAGNEDEFMDLKKSIFKEFNNRFKVNLDENFNNVNFLYPTTSKSFGSVNSTIKNEWINQMANLGFPVDLTYTAKHFFTIKNQIEK